jgi:hypothetical protein
VHRTECCFSRKLKNGAVLRYYYRGRCQPESLLSYLMKRHPQSPLTVCHCRENGGCSPPLNKFFLLARSISRTRHNNNELNRSWGKSCSPYLAATPGLAASFSRCFECLDRPVCIGILAHDQAQHPRATITVFTGPVERLARETVLAHAPTGSN